MNNHLKKWCQVGLYATLTLLMAFFIYHYYPEIVFYLKKLKWQDLGGLVLLQVGIVGLGGYAFHQVAKSVHIYQKWTEWFGLSFIANLLNQLLPYRPGLFFRYFYLKKNYNMHHSDFMIVTLFLLMVLMVVGGCFTVMGWIKTDVFTAFKIFPIAGLGLVVLLGLCLYCLKTDTHAMVSSTKLKRLASTQLVLTAVGIAFVLYMLSALAYYQLFAALGMHVPFYYTVFLSGILGIAILFPVTPGNIGMLETLAGLITLNLNQDFGLGFTVIALYRVTQWIPSLTFSAVFGLWIIRSRIN